MLFKVSYDIAELFIPIGLLAFSHGGSADQLTRNVSSSDHLILIFRNVRTVVADVEKRVIFTSNLCSK